MINADGGEDKTEISETTKTPTLKVVRADKDPALNEICKKNLINNHFCLKCFEFFKKFQCLSKAD